MAIEKTTFVEKSQSGRQTEVYNWLLENATDYFGTITNNASHYNIICTFSGCENANITLNFTNSNNFTVTLENGTKYQSSQSAGQMIDVVKYAIKTSNGICLSNDYDIFTSSDSGGYEGSITFSKNNDGTTCIMFIARNEAIIKKLRYIICPEKSKVLTVTSKVTTADMTSFAPIPFAEGVYPENMFFTPFSSARYSGVITDDNGQKYFYDGYCALKE